MKLFEYQAKDVFRENNIKIPQSYLIDSVESLEDGLKEIGVPCALKSQVLRGGRGKAGLIPLVKTNEEARSEVARLLASEHNVSKILVEEMISIEKELYLSITVDAKKATALVIACVEGGVDIETLAVDSPEKIMFEEVDIIAGIQPFQCKNIAYGLSKDKNIVSQLSKMIYNLYQVFDKYDAELVEINPVFITTEGNVIAGDGKLSIDDNSMYRQKKYEMTREYFDSDMEFEAALEGIPYIQFDGDISLMCAGAGLTTTVYDLINYADGSVANYLEFGGPNYRKAEEAMRLCLKNDSKVILIVTFGTIARADVMADGIVAAIKKLQPDRPIITCIRGTNEIEATKTLKAAGLECLYDTEDAVKRAVEISKASTSSNGGAR
jgi:succinyl-CoA synthetase beta subunit